MYLRIQSCLSSRSVRSDKCETRDSVHLIVLGWVSYQYVKTQVCFNYSLGTVMMTDDHLYNMHQFYKFFHLTDIKKYLGHLVIIISIFCVIKLHNYHN